MVTYPLMMPAQRLETEPQKTAATNNMPTMKSTPSVVEGKIDEGETNLNDEKVTERRGFFTKLKEEQEISLDSQVDNFFDVDYKTIDTVHPWSTLLHYIVKVDLTSEEKKEMYTVILEKNLENIEKNKSS